MPCSAPLVLTASRGVSRRSSLSSGWSEKIEAGKKRGAIAQLIGRQFGNESCNLTVRVKAMLWLGVIAGCLVTRDGPNAAH